MVYFISKNARNWQNWHFLKNQILWFFKLSLVKFDLQKRTIPQIKALDISLWPYEIIFSDWINICWDIVVGSCALFFPQTLVHILVLQYFSRFRTKIWKFSPLLSTFTYKCWQKWAKFSNFRSKAWKILQYQNWKTRQRIWREIWNW